MLEEFPKRLERDISEGAFSSTWIDGRVSNYCYTKPVGKNETSFSSETEPDSCSTLKKSVDHEI